MILCMYRCIALSWAFNHCIFIGETNKNDCMTKTCHIILIAFDPFYCQQQSLIRWCNMYLSKCL